MKRWLAIPLVLVVALAVAALVAFQRKVEVTTGTRYVCTYGESLGSDVRKIQVPAADAGKYTVTTKRYTCRRHRQAEEFYLRAQRALGKGDLKGAAVDLAAVVKLDPKFKQAAAQLQLIKEGKKPKPDGSPPPGQGKTPPEQGTDKPAPPPDQQSPAMDAYLNLVPDNIEGFTAEKISAEALSLTRAYVPKDKTRYDQLVIMAQQCGSKAGSQQFVAGAIKSSYPSGKSVTVSGLSGWFGVNGSGFAAVSLVKGEVALTLELHSTDVKPASLEQDLRTLAANLLR